MNTELPVISPRKPVWWLTGEMGYEPAGISFFKGLVPDSQSNAKFPRLPGVNRRFPVRLDHIIPAILLFSRQFLVRDARCLTSRACCHVSDPMELPDELCDRTYS